jgi:hypothetical protein
VRSNASRRTAPGVARIWGELDEGRNPWTPTDAGCGHNGGSGRAGLRSSALPVSDLQPPDLQRQQTNAWSPGQRILNGLGARQPEHTFNQPVPITARIVWKETARSSSTQLPSAGPVGTCACGCRTPAIGSPRCGSTRRTSAALTWPQVFALRVVQRRVWRSGSIRRPEPAPAMAPWADTGEESGPFTVLRDLRRLAMRAR